MLLFEIILIHRDLLIDMIHLKGIYRHKLYDVVKTEKTKPRFTLLSFFLNNEIQMMQR